MFIHQLHLSLKNFRSGMSDEKSYGVSVSFEAPEGVRFPIHILTPVIRG
jgi:hypothetical protein